MAALVGVPASFAGGLSTVLRSMCAVGSNPEGAVTLVGFVIALFLMAIPAALVAGVVCLLLKAVLDWDTDQTKEAFYIIGGILLAILLLFYLIF